MLEGNSSHRPYDILVVEDNASDVELFMRTLRKVQTDLEMEINARAVTNGAEAAAQLNERKFDVIFLDVNMPPPDGVELTKQIRASEINRTTHIVIVTGAEDRGLMTRTFQAGANLFLFKPVDRMRLLRLIQVSSAPIDRERRRLQRVKVKCRVSVECEQGRVDGETVDLSVGGMLVRANRILPVGSTVEVALVLAPATEPIRTSARIVRIVGSEFMGLQLQRMGKAESDRLGGFLVPLIVAATEGDQ
ncbi:MAG TPA: response regulator [Candidatus Acidoferrales bacterium]|jgi:CheY-like chemotaxis protein|nr:response regulator [Candidatus Acidoferrales bacterium]